VVRNVLIAVLEWLAIWNCRALTPLRIQLELNRAYAEPNARSAACWGGGAAAQVLPALLACMPPRLACSAYASPSTVHWVWNHRGGRE
jgi:hypothetical protein